MEKLTICSGEDHPFLHAFLVDHIAEQVMNYFRNKKGSDFLNCRLVCKNWEETVQRIWKKEDKFVEISSSVKLKSLTNLRNNGVACSIYLSKLRIGLFWRRREVQDNVLMDGQLLHKLLKSVGPNLQELEIEFQMGLSDDMDWLFFKQDVKGRIDLSGLKRLKINGDCEFGGRLHDVHGFDFHLQSGAMRSLMDVLFASATNLTEFKLCMKEEAGMLRQEFVTSISEYLPTSVTILDLSLEGFESKDIIFLAGRKLPIKSLTFSCNPGWLGMVPAPEGIPQFLRSVRSTLQELKVYSKSTPLSVLAGLQKSPILRKFEFNGSPNILFALPVANQDGPTSYFDSLEEITIGLNSSYKLRDLSGNQVIVPKSLRIIRLSGSHVTSELILHIAKYFASVDEFEYEIGPMSTLLECVFKIGAEDKKRMAKNNFVAPLNKMLIDLMTSAPEIFQGFFKLDPQGLAGRSVEEVTISVEYARFSADMENAGFRFICAPGRSNSGVKYTLEAVQQ